jgi:signal transduction histidine kinase
MSANKNTFHNASYPHLPVHLLWIFIVQFCFFCFSISSARSEERTVIVGLYENAPKIFTSENGKPSGIFIDIIEDIAKTEGWNLRFVPGTWAEGLTRLEKKELDLMPDVAFTTDRANIFSFHSEPVLSSWSQVYARNNSGIKSILDLNGKRIAVLQASVQQEAFARLAGSFRLKTTLIPMPDYKAMFESVARGEADAAVANNIFGLMNAKKSGLEDTAVIFNPSALFFAAPANANRQLLEKIDTRLTELKKNPQSIYYTSLKRWTSEEVRFSLPAWLQIILLLIGFVLLVSLGGSFILKHQVNMRTGELKKINREMEQRITERTAELAESMEKAKSADRIKSAFLATMSHELRTPLNSIIGFTGTMLQGLAGPLNEEQNKQLNMVQNSSRHLLALINDVLDISKIEAGQLELSPASFQLKPSIEKIVKLISPMAEKKGLAIHLDIPEDPGIITADQRRLEQIILNLVNNAVKFTEKGYVLVACGMKNGQCILSVSDTGIGIKPEDKSKLFQPFHQIDMGTTRKVEGTGLGLSICKKILDLMGGSIDVQSKLAEGSTFTIQFPIIVEGPI